MEGNQTATATFLRAEEAASRLAEELKRLDAESQRYSEAATTLRAAGEQLKTLADAVRGNTQQTTEVVTAIRSVGSPAIIDGLNLVNGTAGEAREAIQRALTAISDLARLNVEHGQQLGDIRSTVVNELAAMRVAANDHAEKTRSAIERVGSASTAASKTANQELSSIRSALKDSSDQVNRRLGLALMLAGLAAVAAAAAAVASFVR